jgi:hypothetical protein
MRLGALRSITRHPWAVEVAFVSYIISLMQH